jgi:hypothetical protein
MSDRTNTRGLSGWILLAGFVLTSLGLTAQSQDGNGTTTLLPSPSGYGTSDSNGSMIAVTGVDVTGASLLYLVDTVGRHLTIYQAAGGTKSTQNIRWVGARNIDLDLQVDGYNDRSQFTYQELSDKFAKQGNMDLPAKKR